MIRRLAAIWLALAAAAAPAQAAAGAPPPNARAPALNPWPKPGVTVGYRGMTLLRSDRPSSVVIVGVESPYVGPDGWARLLLFVANRSEANAIVTAGSVTAADEAGRPLEVLSLQRMTPAGWPLVDHKAVLNQAARELIAMDPAEFMATTPNGRFGSPAGLGLPAPRTNALAEIAAAAQDPATSASDLAAFAGLAPQTVPPGMMYATGASVQLKPGTKAFDIRVWVGGEDHWFTFQLQR